MATCNPNSKPDPTRLAQDASIKVNLAHIKNKILVMSGKGGVGKSTVAVNLAKGLAQQGYKVGLMDVDLHGPSIPGMLGLTAPAQAGPNSVDPVPAGENLKVISVDVILNEKDTAIIWRGPLKIGVIRQFVADVDWGPLDYLIVDAPPGTGDEPLSVAQTIEDAKAILVTTPQEVSLADVRKSINFCVQVNMDILGLIENMSAMTCPHCGQPIDIFHSGGGEQLAKDKNLNFLGGIPLDPTVVLSSDAGKAVVDFQGADGPAATAYKEIIDRVVKATA